MYKKFNFAAEPKKNVSFSSKIAKLFRLFRLYLLLFYFSTDLLLLLVITEEFEEVKKCFTFNKQNSMAQNMLLFHNYYQYLFKLSSYLD